MPIISKLNLNGTTYDLKAEASGAVSGVKGENEDEYRDGYVEITRENLGLGTAATRSVPASGNANATQVVLGSDTRLTNSYNTGDSASTTINDTDYVPMSASDGTKKKALWSTIVAKIKSALGTAATKNYTTSVTSDSTELITSGAVYSGLANRVAITGDTMTGNLAITGSNGRSVTVTYNNRSTSKANAAGLYADSEGGNLRLSKEGNTGRIELDTYPMNGSSGYARLFLGNSSSVARKVFRFNEDGTFTDGNGQNLSGTVSLNRGWAANGVSMRTLANGYYGVNPNQLPTEVASLTSSYNYFSTYGTLFVNNGGSLGGYPVYKYVDVFGQVAQYNPYQDTWRPFRRPTGNAMAAQVLSGYTFSNESSDGLTGTFKHTGTKTPTGSELNTSALNLGELHSYRYINTAVCYNAGYSQCKSDVATKTITLMAPPAGSWCIIRLPFVCSQVSVGLMEWQVGSYVSGDMLYIRNTSGTNIASTSLTGGTPTLYGANCWEIGVSLSPSSGNRQFYVAFTCH